MRGRRGGYIIAGLTRHGSRCSVGIISCKIAFLAVWIRIRGMPFHSIINHGNHLYIRLTYRGQARRRRPCKRTVESLLIGKRETGIIGESQEAVMPGNAILMFPARIWLDYVDSQVCLI